ncbi:DUF192 domain-containing protein [Alcaligenaceae bacterium]|nr:DUF192 domain-containing protein [Alcaligenaceae bacterium]
MYTAHGFWTRLRGLHAWRFLPCGTGLHLSPCNAIHTFGLAYAIDVVFLDAAFIEIKRVDGIQPNRAAFCWKAASVVELPAGYCAAHPDYAREIRLALFAGLRRWRA